MVIQCDAMMMDEGGAAAANFENTGEKFCSLTGRGSFELPRTHVMTCTALHLKQLLQCGTTRPKRALQCGTWYAAVWYSAAEKGIASSGWAAKMHCKPIACIVFTPQAQKTPFSDEFTEF